MDDERVKEIAKSFEIAVADLRTLAPYEVVRIKIELRQLRVSVSFNHTISLATSANYFFCGLLYIVVFCMFIAN